MKFLAFCITRSRFRYLRFVAGLLVGSGTLGMLVGGPACHAQDQVDATRVAQIAAVNSLDNPDTKPWHLKVSYSTFDEAGKPSGTGMLEEWWAARNSSRLEVTEAGKTSRALTTPDGRFFSTDFVPMSAAVQLMHAQIVHPVSEEDVKDAVPETREQSFANLMFQCTMLSQPVKGLAQIPLGLFPTFCTQGDKLRVSWLSTNINVVSVQSGTFQGHTVPVKIEVVTGKNKQLEAHVDQLGTIPADSIDLSTTNLVKTTLDAVRVSSGLSSALRIKGDPPVYPDRARRNGATGTVVMNATIGTDGRLHAIRVVSSPDPDLSVAALAGVEQWVYKPYLLNGLPCSVKSMLTVNFNLNRR